jgi:hypothetical protein
MDNRVYVYWRLCNRWCMEFQTNPLKVMQLLWNPLGANVSTHREKKNTVLAHTARIFFLFSFFFTVDNHGNGLPVAKFVQMEYGGLQQFLLMYVKFQLFQQAPTPSSCLQGRQRESSLQVTTNHV